MHDGRGFIPQIEYLEKDIKEGNISVEECAERLKRLEAALATMIGYMEKQAEAVQALGMDDMQLGTIAGFMAPARQGLETMLRLVNEIDLDQDWPESLWKDLQEAQFNILRGAEGIAYLGNVMAKAGADNNIDVAEMARQRAAEAEASEAVLSEEAKSEAAE